MDVSSKRLLQQPNISASGIMSGIDAQTSRVVARKIEDQTDPRFLLEPRKVEQQPAQLFNSASFDKVVPKMIEEVAVVRATRPIVRARSAIRLEQLFMERCHGSKPLPD